VFVVLLVGAFDLHKYSTKLVDRSIEKDAALVASDGVLFAASALQHAHRSKRASFLIA
jgi:hypothetical protein